MADMIARLKVDSSEYDAKIKRAAQGLQHFVNTCHEQGDVIGRVLGDTRKYVESLGNMGTVATTVRGRIAELTSGFIEIKSVYNSLSEEEKNAPFGKELSKQLDIMKGRITDAKKELADINKELEQTDTDGKNLGGVLDQLTQKFGVSIKEVVGWGAAIGAAKVALDVAKDAFFASEQNVDEWGRTMQAAQGLYEGFLNALNTGDISGYLNRMDEIVQAARAAYNELDTLVTMKTIQGPQFAKQEAENQRMRSMLMTGRYIAPAVGSGMTAPKGMKEGDLLTPEQIKRIEEKLQSGMNTIVSLTKNELKQTGKAIDAYYDSLAKQNGMSLKEFREGTRNWAEFSERLKGYERYQKFENEHTTYQLTSMGNGEYENRPYRDNAVNPDAKYANWGVFRVDKMDKNSYNDLVNLIKQQQSQQSQMYSSIGQAYRTINRAEGVTVRGLMGGGSGKAAKTYDEGIKLGKGMEGLTGATIVTYESMEDLQRQLNAYKTALNRATNAIDEQAARQGIAATEWKMSDVGRSAAKLGWSQEDMASEVAKMQNTLYSKLEPVKIDFAVNTDSMEDVVEEVTNNTKEMANAWNDAGTAIKNVGSLLSQIEDPAAKVAGIIAEAIASIALTFAQSLKGTVTPWDWIAGAASGTATMISTIAAIKSATDGYATGGIVQGNSRTGDNTLIRANAGELILTEGQQGTIAKTLIEAKEANNIEIGALTNIVTEISSMVGEINLTLNTKILELLNNILNSTEDAATMSLIGAIMPFAHGGVVHAANGWSGIVPGNLMSGDHVPALLDSGEVVLNRAQTSALAADLQRNNQRGITAQPYVSGEQIYLGLNNYLKRSGRGEILTSRG